MNRFQLGDQVLVDLESLTVEHGAEVETLTPMEGALLGRLAAADGDFVPSQTLLVEVWGYAPGVKTRTLTTTLSRLRRKVEPDPNEPVHLLRKRGEGLALVGASSPTENQHAGLLGRGPLLAEAGRRLGAGPLLLTGPLGVGKSALARALMDGWPGPRHWLELGDAPLGDVLSAHFPDVADLGELVACLRPQELLVLDGVTSDHLDASDLSTLLRHPALLLSGPSPLHPKLPILPVPPLAPEDARALLRSAVEAQGGDLTEDLLEQALASTDHLPNELILLGPQLALLGRAALDPALRSISDRIRFALDHLSDDEQQALALLAAFERSFDLYLAAATLEVPPAAALGILKTLQGRGLCRVSTGSFSLLTEVRHRLRDQRPDLVALGRRRLLEALLDDPLELHRTGGRRWVAQRYDLLTALRDAPPEFTERLLQTIDILLECLPRPQLRLAVDALASRAPGPLTRLYHLTVTAWATGTMSEVDQAWLVERAQVDGDAASVAVMFHPDPAVRTASTERRLHLGGPMGSRVFQEPALLYQASRERFEEHVGPLEAWAVANRLEHALAFIEGCRLQNLCHHGAEALVAASPVPEHTGPGTQSLRLTIAVARYLTGDDEGARQALLADGLSHKVQHHLALAIVEGVPEPLALLPLTSLTTSPLTRDSARLLVSLHTGTPADLSEPNVRALAEGRAPPSPSHMVRLLGEHLRRRRP